MLKRVFIISGWVCIYSLLDIGKISLHQKGSQGSLNVQDYWAILEYSESNGTIGIKQKIEKHQIYVNWENWN